MNDEELSSDSSDEDYVPNGVSASEEENSGEDEEQIFKEENDTKINDEKTTKLITGNNIGKRKKSKSSEFSKGNKRKKSNVLPGLDLTKPESETNLEIPNKEKTDKLWEDFLKDESTSQTKSTTANATKVTVVKEYKFAGEIIKVEEEVDNHSKKAKANVVNKIGTVASDGAKSISQVPKQIEPSKGVGGIKSILDKISKKPKINILEKSKLDWQKFTKEEGIEDDLKKHNIGKQGYLERKSFLERTDQKLFEIERDFRLSKKP